LTTKELAVTSCKQTASHFISHQGFFFTQIDMNVVLHPPYFSLYLRLKIKLRGRHSDTIEVTEVESQAVLNTFTEHDFQDALKMAEALGTVHKQGRGLFREDGSQ
jgi:hypothetical protein